MPRRKAADSLRNGGPATTSSATSSPVAPTSSERTLRKRPVPSAAETAAQEKMDHADDRSATAGNDSIAPAPAGSWTSRNEWIVFAVASGACAAVNGCFAKLTTNELTSNISSAIAKAFGLVAFENALELIFRCIFFGLNLVFNGVMWTLFTKALARGTSTTQVSIMNTSSNFMITAILGFMIFSESLPPLWWVGAAMLVAGNVIIGRKDEVVAADPEEDAISGAEAGASVPPYGTVVPTVRVVPPEKDDDDEDVALLGDLDDPNDR
ncbi:uncharacterized protein JN550_001170 [Neoarthrinium moseri]|uniref:uncharacterized protein n=1 Tax=Neoarthrinium moseri TaxID=1658444 RepID=UPI001FDB5158|nr:uncharacterized protein JN550_001170 [Neoarthrinium moseri]KAI1877098.1 hypothetical protein JN550_001170 [Neoarthrinium moseri]